MSRNKFSNRRHTTIAQRLPDDLIETQQAFLAYVMYMRIDHDYPLGLIIANMNETPLLLIFQVTSQSTKQEHDRLVFEQLDTKKPILQLF